MPTDAIRDAPIAESAIARAVPAATQPPRIRFEIQALRALAVLGVLLFHLWPQRLPGGFVGVDVFFVVSGFLITDHILREVARRHTVSLPRFWARRAVRLLPASLTVLVASTVGVWAFVPDGRWAQFGGEILASVFYVENWALAAQSVDYMALSNAKSPVQHFWSLGVEEQFYLLWPVLIIGALALAARRARHGATHTIAVLMITIMVASLVYSIVFTYANPSVAYFSTFTRAWEFAAGGLLAVVLRRAPSPFGAGGAASCASWIGIAMIGIAMVVFTGALPFPSYTAALPVAGTILVIAAGTPRLWFSANALRWRPVQFIGDISYGVYLWHWPLVVLVPYAIGVPLTLPWAIGILGASIMLGWLSKVVIEDPVRRHNWGILRTPRASFLTIAVAMLAVASLAVPLARYVVTAPETPADAAPACYGALSMIDESCGDPSEVPLVASLSSFTVDVPPPDIVACELPTSAGDYRRCDFGTDSGGPHLALIGDSHATRLVEPLRDIVTEGGGKLSTYLVSGCSMMSIQLTGSAWGFEPVYAEQCRSVTERIQDAVIADPTVDTVILTDRTRLYITDAVEYHPLTEEMVADSIDRLATGGKRVVVIADPPEMNAVPPQGGGSAADCLEKARSSDECALPRSEASFADPMAAAATATGSGLVNLDDLFCTEDQCLTRIGGLVVYSDDNHLTRSFARSLIEPLTDRLRPWLQPAE
ncbi:acyltransferase family protein [uncultured Microbacterium sp.]|uniref:acyltransferase family protein n=1 Tax=uncultured Microbacterium sp. TaxID=191216 RepID=UPI002625B49A|nr:acyltransferase family protein [uncultured Microbacterium sp.]